MEKSYLADKEFKDTTKVRKRMEEHRNLTDLEK